VRSIVVLSPHSDDGVLSLGGSMARWARSGRRVELVTVFGLDPASDAAAGGWDRRGGFRTEGDAAHGRREEDRVACALLGVTPRWLDFGSVDFERHGTDDEIWEALSEWADGDSLVFAPGAPLTHPDHADLERLVSERMPAERLARYAEQPYALRASIAPFSSAALSVRDRLAKWRAVRAYRSQLPLLGLRTSRTRGPLRLSFADERYELPSGRVDPRL
jgi:LmbE family N-acetylglucosaminyl deacetylase